MSNLGIGTYLGREILPHVILVWCTINKTHWPSLQGCFLLSTHLIVDTAQSPPGPMMLKLLPTVSAGTIHSSDEQMVLRPELTVSVPLSLESVSSHPNLWQVYSGSSFNAPALSWAILFHRCSFQGAAWPEFTNALKGKREAPCLSMLGNILTQGSGINFFFLDICVWISN